MFWLISINQPIEWFMSICRYLYFTKPGIIVFRKLQSDVFVRFQTFFPLILVVFYINILLIFTCSLIFLSKDTSLVQLQEGGMYGSLREHLFEVYRTWLCLVLNLFKNKLLVHEEGMIRVLQMHCSEACKRQLCLVSACIFWISRLKNNNILSIILIEQSYVAQ